MADSTKPTRGEARSARLIARDDLTENLAVFQLALDGGAPDFQAGQWMKLGLRDAASGGEPVWRPYTIASAPHDERLSFYIRRVWKPTPGRLTTRLWALKPGEEVLWQAPRGHFTLAGWRAESSPRALLMIAGGTGLAPFVSQVESLWRSGAPAPVTLCHGASYADELGYRRRFEELARARRDAAGGSWDFVYLPTVSRPTHPRNAGWSGLGGRVESLLARPLNGGASPVERARAGALDPTRTLALVCGYTRTIDNVLAELRARGFEGPRKRADGSLDVQVDSFGDDEPTSTAP